ncbi:hypothetical protein Q8W23_08725 [Tenacibaculum discolor]|uniref:Peptidase U49-like protein n=1 Tax=Tenacibaculum discolor TaxID=361581 RepID=A0ABT9F4C7_9FLAO|nr:hypothetical protein [Tenacibaculum discolor]
MNTSITSDEIYDLEFYQNKEEVLKAFKFYNETLINNYYYGIDPSYLFFENNLSINAKATKDVDGKYIISINIGTIHFLIEKIKKTNIFDNVVVVKLLQPYFDLPISVLMYQMGLHFTFYHELAHLIQKSEYLNNSMVEENSDVFDLKKHVLEMDADSFSGVMMSTHVLQYSEKMLPRANKEIYQGLFIIFLIPIILYLLSFKGNDKEFYLFENSHPHPSIRLISIIMTIIDYAKITLEKKEISFKNDEVFEILILSMSICEESQELLFDDKRVSKLKAIYINNKIEIIRYIKRIEEEKENYINDLAISKRNQHIF